MLCGGEDGCVLDAEIDASEAECSQVGRFFGGLDRVLFRFFFEQLLDLLLYLLGAPFVGDAISLLLDVLRLTDQLNHQVVILLLFVCQPLTS